MRITALLAPRLPPLLQHRQPLRRIISTSAAAPAPLIVAGRLSSTKPTIAAVAAAAASRSRLPPARTIMASAASKRLSGKTVLITGASSGIGRSTALEFAHTSPQDLRLVLAARRVDSLREIADQIRNEVGDGVKVLPAKLDVSNADEVRGFVAGLPEEWRDIHVLVNNA